MCAWQLRNEFDEVLDAVIQEHRDLASGKRPGGNPNDFISALLELPGENGAPHLDEKTIKAITIVSRLALIDNVFIYRVKLLFCNKLLTTNVNAPFPLLSLTLPREPKFHRLSTKPYNPELKIQEDVHS